MRTAWLLAVLLAALGAACGDPVCPDGKNCSCSGCTRDCPGASGCNMTCTAGTCAFQCPGGACNFTALSGAKLTATCKGTNCNFTCAAGASACALNDCGQGCTMACNGVAACTLSCDAAAGCTRAP